MKTEKNLWIFIGVSAIVHLVFLINSITYTLPRSSKDFLEVDLMEIGDPRKNPGNVSKSILQELKKPMVPAMITENFIPSALEESAPVPQITDLVSAPSGGTDQQSEMGDGGGGGMDALQYAYMVMVKQKIQEAMEDAFKRNLTGNSFLKIKFNILANGHVTDVRISLSSGSPILDEFSVGVIKKIASFPPPPYNQQLSLDAPISYRVPQEGPGTHN